MSNKQLKTTEKSVSRTFQEQAERDRAVSEVVATVLLISIIALAASIFAVGMISQVGTDDTLPAVRINFSSSGSTVYLEHQGGDPIPDDELRILIDGSEVDFSGQTGGDDWSIGEVLEYPGTLELVQIIYAGNSRSDLLYSFSQEVTPSPDTTHGNTILLIAYDKPAQLISGTYIKFTYTGPANEWWTNGWIRFDDGETVNFATNDIVKLVLNSDETSGRMDMTSSTISGFPFSVTLYLNENPTPEKIGTIQTIWISNFDDYDSTLTFQTPSGIGYNEMTVDGDTIIHSDPPTSNAVSIYNIGPAAAGATYIILEGTRPEIHCSGDYEIL